MDTRLKELRLENGLRQKDVAEKIGVCTASYGFYENWINKPDPETLVKLANLYNVSIDYLLGITDEYKEKNAPTNVSAYNSEERQLIESYRELNPAGKNLINETMKTLLGVSADGKKIKYK